MNYVFSLEVIVWGAFSLTLRSVVKSMKKKETQIKKMAENSEKKIKIISASEMLYVFKKKYL